jgi:hypothetical protein
MLLTTKDLWNYSFFFKKKFCRSSHEDRIYVCSDSSGFVYGGDGDVGRIYTHFPFASVRMHEAEVLQYITLFRFAK